MCGRNLTRPDPKFDRGVVTPNVLFRCGGDIRHPLLRGSHLDAVGGPGRRAHPGSAWLAAVLPPTHSSAAGRGRGTGGDRSGGRAGPPSPSPAPRAGAGTGLHGGRGERAGAPIRGPAGRRHGRQAGRRTAPATRPLTGPPDVGVSRSRRSAGERLTIALSATVEPCRCRERRDHDLEGEGGGKERSGDGQGRRARRSGLAEASAWSTAQAPGTSAAREPGTLSRLQLGAGQIGLGAFSTAAS
jgi:hypothetical protein